MTRVAVDTWAFLEMFYNGPRKPEVEEVLRKADGLVTSRDVVVETASFIVGRSRRTRSVWEWLNPLRAGRTQVVEPPMATVEGFMRDLGPESTLSYADASLAVVALQQNIEHVATEDGGFRELRLVPLFAREPRRR